MDRFPAPKRFATTLSLKASRKPDPVPESPAPVAAPPVPFPPAKPKKQKPVAAGQEAVAPKQGEPPHQPPYQPRASDDAATQLAEWLGQHSAVWHDFQPLNIGVISEVYALLAADGLQDTYSKRVIHKALHWHTSRASYLRNLLSQPHRYSLAGQVGGEVAQEQREHAGAVLDGRKGRKERKRQAHQPAPPIL